MGGASDRVRLVGVATLWLFGAACHSAKDSSDDGGEADAGADAAGGCNHEFDNPACWTSHDVRSTPFDVIGFFGAVFDGRYVVYISSGSPSSFRYDTQGDFASSAAWTTVDTAVSGESYEGGAFDGRYVYFAPTSGAIGDETDSVGRYDTQGAFDSAESWSLFDISTGPVSSAPGYSGAAFDGRYVYFAPGIKGMPGPGVEAPSGRVARYDTQGTFTDGGSWSYFDVNGVDARAVDFAGAVFDGRYLYLVPHADFGQNLGHVLAARYDTRASFFDAASWSMFDPTTLDPSATGFTGGVFDGRYVYYIPNSETLAPVDAGGTGCVFARYDTQGAFTSAESWAVFDTALLDRVSPPWNFQGGAFDGRYLYFMPAIKPARSGEPILRYDTQAAFTAPDSWSQSTIPGAGFAGTAFDGRYLYLVPEDRGLVWRFDATTPPAVPSSYRGSFY